MAAFRHLACSGSENNVGVCISHWACRLILLVPKYRCICATVRQLLRTALQQDSQDAETAISDDFVGPHTALQNVANYFWYFL